MLIPKGMALGGGAFGRCLGLEGGALVSGISAPTEKPEPPPPGEVALSVNQQAGSPQTLNLPVP